MDTDPFKKPENRALIAAAATLMFKECKTFEVYSAFSAEHDIETELFATIPECIQFAEAGNYDAEHLENFYRFLRELELSFFGHCVEDGF